MEGVSVTQAFLGAYGWGAQAVTDLKAVDDVLDAAADVIEAD